MVLDNGPLAYTITKAAAEATHSCDPNLTSTYTTTESLNIRNSAGTAANEFSKDKTVLVDIPMSVKVMCPGAYTTVGFKKWLYVHFKRNGMAYTGFASAKYPVRV